VCSLNFTPPLSEFRALSQISTPKSLGFSLEKNHKETPPKGGARGLIFLSQNHFISFKSRTWRSTINQSELIALKLVLIISMVKWITQLQFLVDSLLVIKWLKGETMLRNFNLHPFVCDIKNLQALFSHINFSHVYRENNLEDDRLSKYGLELQEGNWKSMSPSKDKLFLTFMSHGFNILSVLSDDLEKYVTSNIVLELSFECFKVISISIKLFLNTWQVAFVKNLFKGWSDIP